MSAPRYFLRQIYAERYGAFTKRELGPFKQGLNVVFGPNEAGKSTFSTLVGGILFGWEDTHGVHNTYQPVDAERSGMLTFESCRGGQQYLQPELGEQQGVQHLVRIARVGDEPLSGARDSQDAVILSDIDQATYRTMFSFSADELRSLENTNDVTTQLLSAGSGTAQSPSAVYVELEQRIAALTSLSPDASDSVIVLAQQLEEKRAQIQEEARRVEHYKQSDREFRELLSNREDANARLNELDHAIEQLTKARAELHDIEDRLRQLQRELNEAMREQQILQQQAESATDIDPHLLSLDANETRRLRDRLEEFDAERQKLMRVEDAAKENSTTSTAGYEALVELDQQNKADEGKTKVSPRKAGLVAACSVPGLIFFAAGIALFFYGRRIISLSFTVLALSLIALSFVLGIAAVVSMRHIIRGNANITSRIKDAQWVMLQDKKRLDSSHAELDELQKRIKIFLEEAHLAQAEGSLRQARALLEDAHEARQVRAQNEQRDAALQLRIEMLQQEIDRLEARRDSWEEKLQLQPGAQLEDVESILEERLAQRAALRTITEETSHRIGQLGQELQAARDDIVFDKIKLDAEIIRSRLRQSKEQLTELLLARRMLERAMNSWEGDNQPRVYEEAGRLLSLITDGQWVQVSTSSTGSIVAINREGEQVKPRHLSLGTCQQLYLALRVALLLTAQDVGASIPVMADDILVNFDKQRRLGAARVLVELARSRQVIVFTCHQETVDALREAATASQFEPNYLVMTR